MPKSAAGESVRPPRLPKRLPAGSLARLEDFGEYAARELRRTDLSGQKAEAPSFAEVVFDKTRLSGTEFSKPRLQDCRLRSADLSAARWEHVRLRRVEIVDSRLLGADWTESDLEDVLFRSCTLDGILLAASRWRSVRLENCSLKNAVLENAELPGAVFLDCDLAGADLRGALLAGADFRGSKLGGLQAGPKEMKGAIVDSLQAVQVAAILGVVVKEKGED
jgi:uncharacterized protein YjbI with pentapeptide repeats